MSQFEYRNARPPRESVQALRRIGGTNVYGAERFRLVWGWDVRDFTGKNLFFRYDIPERWLERFHLEYWVSPGTYGSPETWDYKGMNETNGPFPRGGDYERFITFEHAKTHEFLYPAPHLVEEAVRLFRSRTKPTDNELAAEINGRRLMKQEATRKHRHDIIDDNIAAFGLSPWMPVSGPMTPTNRRTDWRNKL